MSPPGPQWRRRAMSGIQGRALHDACRRIEVHTHGRGPSPHKGDSPSMMGAPESHPYPLWCAALPPSGRLFARSPSGAWRAFCAPRPARGGPPAAAVAAPFRALAPPSGPRGRGGGRAPRLSRSGACAPLARLRGLSLAPLCFGLALALRRPPCPVGLALLVRGSGASRVPRRVPPRPPFCPGGFRRGGLRAFGPCLRLRPPRLFSARRALARLAAPLPAPLRGVPGACPGLRPRSGSRFSRPCRGPPGGLRPPPVRRFRCGSQSENCKLPLDFRREPC